MNVRGNIVKKTETIKRDGRERPQHLSPDYAGKVINLKATVAAAVVGALCGWLAAPWLAPERFH